MLFKKKNQKELEERMTNLENAFNALTNYLDVDVVDAGYTVKDKSFGFKAKGGKNER